MKYFYIIILFFIAIRVDAQEPIYNQMRSNYQFRGTRIDSLLLLPKYNDTIDAPVSIDGSVIRVADKIYVRYNGKWNTPTGGGGGGDYVPYTGATQDVDLGANSIDAKFMKITGTGGNGRIDLKHQSADATAQGSSSVLFANSQGYPKWKNDNKYYSTLAMPQTADRVYIFENKSYTLGDSVDIAIRVKYTDTAAMLTNYAKISHVNLKVNISDTANMLSNYFKSNDSTLYQTKYRSDSMRLNIYNTLNVKLNVLDTSNMLSNYAKTSTVNVKLNISDTSSMLSNYAKISALNLKLNISDSAAMLSSYQRMTAFPVATFGAGSGAAGDTTAFSTSAIYGSFYLNTGADTIVVTGYTAVVQGTSASITPTIYFNDSLNVTAGATKIVNSPSAVTSTTTGNTVTALDNTKIAPGNFVWVSSGTVTTKPTYFNLTLIGYRKR